MGRGSPRRAGAATAPTSPRHSKAPTGWAPAATSVASDRSAARGRRQHEVHPDQDRTGDREQPGIEERRAVPARSVAAQHVAEADSEEGVAGELDDVAGDETDGQEDEAGHQGAAGRQLGAGLGVGDARRGDG